MANIHEYLLSTDKFNNPKVLSGYQAIVILLYRLIVMNPGESRMYPDMGVGLYKFWRYCEPEKLPQLQMEIENQINTYIPSLNGATVNVEESKKIAHTVEITITISKTIYTFNFNQSNNKLETIEHLMNTDINV